MKTVMKWLGIIMGCFLLMILCIVAVNFYNHIQNSRQVTSVVQAAQPRPQTPSSLSPQMEDYRNKLYSYVVQHYKSENLQITQEKGPNPKTGSNGSSWF